MNGLPFLKTPDVKIPIPDPSYLEKFPIPNESKRESKYEREYDAYCKWAALPREQRSPKKMEALGTNNIIIKRQDFEEKIEKQKEIRRLTNGLALTDVEILRKCNFLGVTTNNPNSRAEKLYSPHLPFMHYDEQWIKLYRVAGFCGEESDVYLLKEEYLNEALSIAKSQKINCEPSGIAGLALMLQLRNKLPKDKKMLVVNTGKTKYA